MEKSTLLNYLFWGYQSKMDGKEYTDLKNALVQHDKNIKADDAAQLANSVLKNYPQFKVMHNSFMREKTERISSDVSVIKWIMIIYFVCSIIAVMAIAAEFSK